MARRGSVLMVIAGTIAVVLVASLALAALGRIPWWSFWIVAASAAFVAYVVIPRLKRRP